MSQRHNETDPDGNADMPPSQSPNPLLGVSHTLCWPPGPSPLVTSSSCTSSSCCLLLCLQQVPSPHLPRAAFSLIPHTKFTRPLKLLITLPPPPPPRRSYHQLSAPGAPLCPQASMHPTGVFPAAEAETVTKISAWSFPRIWTLRSRQVLPLISFMTSS